VTKIDFFGRGYEPFDESEFSRRRPVVVSARGESIVVKSAEDPFSASSSGFAKAAGFRKSNGATSYRCSAPAKHAPPELPGL
jgi:hypothetical protein